jgi:thiosulfate reductase cytochrome b subunit
VGTAEEVHARESRSFAGLTRRRQQATIVAGVVLLAVVAALVLGARVVVASVPLSDFIATYPGEYPLPDGAPVGIPAWLGWQHFFNTFLLVLIVRSGLESRRGASTGSLWASRRNKRRKMTVTVWLHLALDALWIVNGAVFVVLLAITGQWMKIVPTSWDVFPNAVSAGLQYLSLDWPTHNGWVNYNSLQQLSYFATVFIAAPVAIVTGARLSAYWPRRAERLNRIVPFEPAKRLHVAVMIYFVAFTVVHVALVFATGALRNLNHMYAGQDAVTWVGFWVFVASMGVVAAGWLIARPSLLVPIARRFGDVKER